MERREEIGNGREKSPQISVWSRPCCRTPGRRVTRCLSVLNALLVCFVVYRVVFVVGARERNGRRERRPGTAVASCSRIDRRRKDVESGDWLGTRQTRQFYRLVCCPLVNLFYKYFPSSSSKPTQYRLSTDNQRVHLALCIAVLFSRYVISQRTVFFVS